MGCVHPAGRHHVYDEWPVLSLLIDVTSSHLRDENT